MAKKNKPAKSDDVTEEPNEFAKFDPTEGEDVGDDTAEFPQEPVEPEKPSIEDVSNRCSLNVTQGREIVGIKTVEGTDPIIAQAHEVLMEIVVAGPPLSSFTRLKIQNVVMAIEEKYGIKEPKEKK